jgi:DNA polymerase III subunit alpha
LDGIRGSIDAVVFPSAYATCQHVLTADAPILVTGNLSRDDEQKIMVTEIQPLGEAGNHYADIFTVSIPEEAITEELITRMRDVLETHPGKTGVRLVLRYPMGVRVRISPHSRFEVHPCGQLVADLVALHEGITAKANARQPVAPARGGGRGSFRQG